MTPRPVVVKVGGSLFDLPDLAGRLGGWLDAQGPTRALLLPGGGPLVDAVRGLDRVHRIGEEASHWLALHALSVNARFLAGLLPGVAVRASLADLPAGACAIVDPLPFFTEDEQHAGRLPHLWAVTSDALAVRLAARAGAGELVLLKSVAWAATDDWTAAAAAGVVDGHFVQALRGAPGLGVRVVNLRDPACQPRHG